MCGVLGFVGQPREGQWRQTHRLLTALYRQSLCRGTDATGFAAVAESFKRGVSPELLTAKAPVPADVFVESPAWQQLRHRRCYSLIGHVRLASTGPAEINANNHPHISPDQSLALIHNGHLRNWKALAEERGWRLRSGCDSEVILRLAEEARHPAYGLTEALTVCEGSMAAVLLDAKRGGVLWMARNSSPLWLIRLTGDKRTFFASTRSILVEAFGKVLGEGWKATIDLLVPLAAGYVHGLSPKGGFVGLGQ